MEKHRDYALILIGGVAVKLIASSSWPYRSLRSIPGHSILMESQREPLLPCFVEIHHVIKHLMERLGEYDGEPTDWL